MKKALLLFGLCFFVFVSCKSTPLKPPPTTVSTQSEVKQVEVPANVEKEPFLSGVKILLDNGTWVEASNPELKKIPSVFIQRWRGYGPSFQLKFPQDGQLQEIYKNYCLTWGNESECAEKTDLRIRIRNVKKNEIVRVLTGTFLYLDQYLINHPGGYFSGVHPREITDPEWQPAKIEKKFKSLKELRKFAEKNRYWMVIAGPKSAPLYGWMNNGLPVYELSHKKRTFIVFGMDMKKTAKPEWPTGEWDPVHIKYRYLGIYWGGHDTAWGPGCISIFGFPKGADTNDIDPIMMVQLAKDGKIFWYDEPRPEFALETLQ